MLKGNPSVGRINPYCKGTIGIPLILIYIPISIWISFKYRIDFIITITHLILSIRTTISLIRRTFIIKLGNIIIAIVVIVITIIIFTQTIILTISDNMIHK